MFTRHKQRGNFLLPLLLDNSSVFIYLIVFLLHVEEMLCDFRAGVMSQNLALKHTISFWDPAVIFRLPGSTQLKHIVHSGLGKLK